MRNIYTQISSAELVKGLVLLILHIYFNALERTTHIGDGRYGALVRHITTASARAAEILIVL